MSREISPLPSAPRADRGSQTRRRAALRRRSVSSARPPRAGAAGGAVARHASSASGDGAAKPDTKHRTTTPGAFVVTLARPLPRCAAPAALLAPRARLEASRHGRSRNAAAQKDHDVLPSLPYRCNPATSERPRMTKNDRESPCLPLCASSARAGGRASRSSTSAPRPPRPSTWPSTRPTWRTTWGCGNAGLRRPSSFMLPFEGEGVFSHTHMYTRRAWRTAGSA